MYNPNNKSIEKTVAETILEMPKNDTSAKPFKARGANGKDYIVKTLLNNQPKVLPNELIGSLLAWKLDLPVLNFALIECPDILTNQIPESSVVSGVYFGSEFLQGSFDLRTYSSTGLNKLFDKISLNNKEDLPGVVGFDNWLLNKDRNNLGNNLLRFTGTQDQAFANYYMIDFGHCFTGPNWTKESLKSDQGRTEIVPIYPLLERQISTHNLSFDKFKSTIENNISDPIFDEILKFVPQEWPITIEEANVLKDFLNARIPIVIKMIQGNLLS